MLKILKNGRRNGGSVIYCKRNLQMKIIKWFEIFHKIWGFREIKPFLKSGGGQQKQFVSIFGYFGLKPFLTWKYFRLCSRSCLTYIFGLQRFILDLQVFIPILHWNSLVLNSNLSLHFSLQVLLLATELQQQQ